MTIRQCWPLPALLLLFALEGCSSDLVTVTGTLKYKGQPVPHTYVIFQPAEAGKRASRGLTDDNGHFTLTNSREASGALLGRHTVTIASHHTTDPNLLKEMKAVFAKYGDAKTSNLAYEITSNNQHIEINLE
jgi:hypothetical protein